MSATIELVFDRTCPNADGARAQLRVALARVGIAGEWTEWDRDAADSPPHVRRYASPTILVNGRDVVDSGAGGTTLDGMAGCRIYVDHSGTLSGVPPMEALVAALVADGGGAGP